MTLYSALDDFQERSLRSVSGLLRRLIYVIGLRSSDGSYSHWGLERVHGSVAARDAVALAHKRLVTAILRMPLSKLLEDARVLQLAEENQGKDWLADLNRQRAQALPPGPGAGTERHFNAVLAALSSLLNSPR
jgi:hypothetical protein